MDTAGAEALRTRLEVQSHWLLAPAVRDGLQPRSDPDAPALVEIRDDERLYADADGPFLKRLVDGAWERIEID